MSTLVINEVFRAWQGEGPSAGRRCSFIRLMGCNLDCSWQLPDGSRSPCDESQTWDASRFDLRAQGTRMEARDVADAALECDRAMAVITGGEPLLHQDQAGWAELLSRLHAARVRVEFETNGTQVPTVTTGRAAAQYNVSPKLASSGVDRARAIVPAAMTALARDRRSVFKFVCAGVEDLDEAGALAATFAIPARRMWVMPAGTTPAEITEGARKLAPAVLDAGWNLTLRQHVLVYGEEGEPR